MVTEDQSEDSFFHQVEQRASVLKAKEIKIKIAHNLALAYLLMALIDKRVYWYHTKTSCHSTSQAKPQEKKAIADTVM
jgi:hypothetical protein